MTSDTATTSQEQVQGSGEVRFPQGFVWGAATAAYQIEGAARDDGRGPSIWDTFSRTPGKVVRRAHRRRRLRPLPPVPRRRRAHGRARPGRLPVLRRVAADPARRHRAGRATRPRLLRPARRRAARRTASSRSSRSTTGTCRRRSRTVGGWTARETAEAFAEYAQVVHGRLGDRVRTWTTLNEPWCSAYLGYASGRHAPGRQDPAAAFAAVHHLLLGHGLAVQALRAAGAETLGITLNPAAVFPADTGSEPDAAAARLVDGICQPDLLRPAAARRVPRRRARACRPVHAGPVRAAGDAAVIAAPIDLLGINYYSPTYVAARPGAGGSPAHPGTEDIAFLPAAGPVTDMGWRIEPDALRRLLERIAADYPGVPLYITENGAAYPTGRTPRAAGRGSPTASGSPTSTVTCGPRTRRSPPASTCAGTSSGR